MHHGSGFASDHSHNLLSGGCPKPKDHVLEIVLSPPRAMPHDRVAVCGYRRALLHQAAPAVAQVARHHRGVLVLRQEPRSILPQETLDSSDNFMCLFDLAFGTGFTENGKLFHPLGQ